MRPYITLFALLAGVVTAEDSDAKFILDYNKLDFACQAEPIASGVEDNIDDDGSPCNADAFFGRGFGPIILAGGGFASRFNTATGLTLSLEAPVCKVQGNRSSEAWLKDVQDLQRDAKQYCISNPAALAAPVIGAASFGTPCSFKFFGDSSCVPQPQAASLRATILGAGVGSAGDHCFPNSDPCAALLSLNAKIAQQSQQYAIFYGIVRGTAVDANGDVTKASILAGIGGTVGVTDAEADALVNVLGTVNTFLMKLGQQATIEFNYCVNNNRDAKYVADSAYTEGDANDIGLAGFLKIFRSFSEFEVAATVNKYVLAKRGTTSCEVDDAVLSKLEMELGLQALDTTDPTWLDQVQTKFMENAVKTKCFEVDGFAKSYNEVTSTVTPIVIKQERKFSKYGPSSAGSSELIGWSAVSCPNGVKSEIVSSLPPVDSDFDRTLKYTLKHYPRASLERIIPGVELRGVTDAQAAATCGDLKAEYQGKQCCPSE
jgi:hypothetical protein